MKVERFAAPLGGRVLDCDVRSLSQDQWQQINEWFLQYHVLAFPNQELTPQDQVDFAQRWGELVPFPYGGLPDYPNIIPLKNQGKKQDVNQHWHSDMTYNQAPPKLTMLYAIEAPKLGGATAFANQVLAYQELSEGLKQTLREQNAHHSARGLARLYGQNEDEAPEALHPVVRVHDESNLEALYVCRAFTTHFEGWSKSDSKALLEHLYTQSVRLEYQARHEWQPNDLVMWDNRAVLHYAVHDHGDEPRYILRCQVQGQSTLSV